MRYELTKSNIPRNHFNPFLTDRMLTNFFTNNSDDVPSAAYPTVDIIEKKDRYLVHADLPGMLQKDIDVTLANGVLTIKGERKSHSESEGDGYSRSERVTGQFLRSFSVTDVEEKDIKADYKEGVLTINLPKTTEKIERKIQIN